MVALASRCFPHPTLSLASGQTLKHLKRSQGAPTRRWREWIWLNGPTGLHRNSPQGLNISSMRLQPFHRFTYVTAHSSNIPSLQLRQSSFSNPSVVSPTSQLILQPFRCFTYVTGTSPTSPGEPPMLVILHMSQRSVYSNKYCEWVPVFGSTRPSLSGSGLAPLNNIYTRIFH